MKLFAPFLLFLIVFSCTKVTNKKTNPVVVSLLGKSYFEPERSPLAQARLDSNLSVAKVNWENDPSEENYIWYGRRLAYLSHFQEAIDIFTEGLGKYPQSAKLLRHRGHRYISLRHFDKAIEDLTAANSLIADAPLEIEPDGSPNKLNIPLSNTQFNIRYHLGLAHYLVGDFSSAEKAYLECLKACDNDDSRVATIDWLYMTYRRRDNKTAAASLLTTVTDSMKIIENDSYFKRCLMYQGKIPPDSLLVVGLGEGDADLALATQGYGVGNWYYYSGDSSKAKKVFEKVVSGKYFSAFGFIAAESELVRWKK